VGVFLFLFLFLFLSQYTRARAGPTSSILGCMGDRPYPFPAVLVDDIIECCCGCAATREGGGGGGGGGDQRLKDEVQGAQLALLVVLREAGSSILAVLVEQSISNGNTASTQPALARFIP
jgi:hypothetical protein